MNSDSAFSVHVFIITEVWVIGLHFSFNHRLLPSAAGHHQTNEESLKTTMKAHMTKYIKAHFIANVENI